MFQARVVIFFGIHLIPFFTRLKSFLHTTFGENLCKGMFSLVSLAGLLMIIFGFESSSSNLYKVNSDALLYSKYVMFFSLTFLVSSCPSTHIKKITRHPMSLGIAIWATLHLTVNPDTASIVLFGSFLAYSAVSALFSELKDTEKEANEAKIVFDVFSVVLGIFLTFLTFNYHEDLSGISLY